MASAFAKALDRSVRAETLPRARRSEIFRSEGMRNSLPCMQAASDLTAAGSTFQTRAPERAPVGSISIVLSQLW